MKKIVKWVGLVVVLAAAGFVLYNLKSGGVSAEVLKVSKGEIKEYLEETAEVMNREKQTVYIEGSGRILNIGADIGDTVKTGDLLLSLEKADLELQLKNAEAGIEASRAQLKGTELINYANKIELAKVAVDQAKITHDSAQKSLENARRLYESKIMSKDEFDRTQDVYKAAAAALDSANLQLADVRQGAPEYLKSSYRAQLEQAVIQRDSILRSIQKQEVRAPMDGIILERLVQRNSPAAPSTAAFVIANVNDLELEAHILADDAGKIKTGVEVEITGKAINDAVLKGKVIKIAPNAKTVISSLGVNQKRVPVTIEMSEKSSLLKPGYNLDIKLITAVKKDAVLVPDSAVFEYKGKSHVFVVNNNKAFLKTVQRGIESGDMVEIQDGLAEGDMILVKPDNNIKEGVSIKPLNTVDGESGKAVQ